MKFFRFFFQATLMLLATFTAVASRAEGPHGTSKIQPPASTQPATNTLSKDLKLNLERIAKVYEFYDCTKTVTKNAAGQLATACADATLNPHVPQVRSTSTPPSTTSVVCTYDGDHYVVSAEGSPGLAVFHLDKSGHVAEIVRGETTVSTQVCRGLFDQKGEGSRPDAAPVDSASTELCFSYYPSKKANDYRAEPVCVADTQSPVTAADKSRDPASTQSASSDPASTVDEEIAPPVKSYDAKSNGARSNGAKFNNTKFNDAQPSNEPPLDVVLPENSEH